MFPSPLCKPCSHGTLPLISCRPPAQQQYCTLPLPAPHQRGCPHTAIAKQPASSLQGWACAAQQTSLRAQQHSMSRALQRGACSTRAAAAAASRQQLQLPSAGPTHLRQLASHNCCICLPMPAATGMHHLVMCTVCQQPRAGQAGHQVCHQSTPALNWRRSLPFFLSLLQICCCIKGQSSTLRCSPGAVDLDCASTAASQVAPAAATAGKLHASSLLSRVQTIALMVQLARSRTFRPVLWHVHPQTIRNICDNGLPAIHQLSNSCCSRSQPCIQQPATPGCSARMPQTCSPLRWRFSMPNCESHTSAALDTHCTRLASLPQLSRHHPSCSSVPVPTHQQGACL